MPLSNTQGVPRGKETVLLVEPDPETRTLAAFMLSKLGYQVLEARNAAESIKLYEAHRADIHLLLVEVLMSRLNGHELAQMLQASDPGLRVLFLADTDYERLARKVAAQKGVTFLPRPFTMSVLAGKVRQVLDAPLALSRTAAAGD